MNQENDSTSEYTVNPWTFCSPSLKKWIVEQIPEQPAYGEIPWAVPSKLLAESKVALLSSAGLSIVGDPPFDMDGERRQPMWGDPSWRRIGVDATAANVEVNHLHIKTDHIREDLNVALPLDRLVRGSEADRLASR